MSMKLFAAIDIGSYEVEMKIFQNMSYREIARALDLSEGSVHTHVKRAYKFIRESMPEVYLFMLF